MASPLPFLKLSDVLKSCLGELLKAEWLKDAFGHVRRGQDYPSERGCLSPSAVLWGSKALLPESEQGAVITNRPGSVTTRSITLDSWL